MNTQTKPAFFSPKKRTIVRHIFELRENGRLSFQALAMAVLWKLVPSYAVRRAFRDFSTPPRKLHPDVELAALTRGHAFSMPLQEGRLTAWRWGRENEPAVILVHGWGGRGTQLHRFIAPLLARGLSVVTYDAPGHGMAGGKQSSLPQMLDALDTVLARTGEVRGIIGHSVGGALTALTLARHPEIPAAVLISPPASWAGWLNNIARVLHWPEVMRDGVQGHIERRFGIKMNELEAENSTGPQPLLVIHDQNDREVSLSQGRRHVANWPNARLMETRGLGHRRILDDAEVISAAVSFVAGDQS